MIAPLSLVKAILSCSIVFFFEKISFKNLAYRGIRDKASAKGMLMQIFLSMLTNLLNCASKLGLARLNEKGLWVYQVVSHPLPWHSHSKA